MIPDLPVPRAAASFRDVNILPVSRFAECSFLECGDDVRFLQIGDDHVLSLCEAHGHQLLEEALGQPVQFGESLGRIVRDQPKG